MHTKLKNIFFYLFSLFFLFSLITQAQNVTSNIDLPGEVIAGEDIEVSIQISKGNLTGFARIQQTFPQAINITAIESAGADFSFSEGKVNIIWLNLPSNPDLEVKYKLTTSTFVQGSLEIGGKFSYIIDNDREEINLGPNTLLIKPSPNTEPNDIVDVYAFSGSAVSTQGPGEALNVSAFREVPYLSESSDGWIVNVLVSRGQVDKLARVEETIPEGFAAENMNGNDAIFTFKRGIAKYLWMKMPEEALFMVSYKVVPTAGTTIQAPEIEGIFSYMMNDEVSTITIVQKNLTLHTMTEAELTGLVKSTGLSAGSEHVVAASTPTEQTKPTQVVQEPTPAPSRQEPSPTKVVKEPLPPQEGIYFRVQLIATSKPLAAERYFSKYQLGEIFKEEHEGLFKYTTGSFKLYRDAKAYINRLSIETDIKKAFVTAYRDDRRITVNEALKLSQQKWTK